MATKILEDIPTQELEQLFELGWREDIGDGDITSLATIAEDQVSTAYLVAKQKGIIAGLPLVERLVKKTPTPLTLECYVKEGDEVNPGLTLGKIEGSTRHILSLERILLNFFQHLCGVATIAREYSLMTEGSKTEILDTRKTLPGYRALDKYAVKVGGCTNHRVGLHDQILIKDNHIEACGSVREAVDKAYAKYADKYIIEAEVTSLGQLQTLKDSRVNWVMLDNMDKASMRECIEWKEASMPELKLEASGNMTLEKVKELSHIGLDYISIGAITHSVKAMDISLKFAEKG